MTLFHRESWIALNLSCIVACRFGIFSENIQKKWLVCHIQYNFCAASRSCKLLNSLGMVDSEIAWSGLGLINLVHGHITFYAMGSNSTTKKREFFSEFTTNSNMLNNLLVCVQFNLNKSIQYTIHQYHNPGKLSRLGRHATCIFPNHQSQHEV